MQKITQNINQYFPKPYTYFGGNVKVGLDVSNHATKFKATEPTGFFILKKVGSLQFDKIL